MLLDDKAVDAQRQVTTAATVVGCANADEDEVWVDGQCVFSGTAEEILEWNKENHFVGATVRLTSTRRSF